MENSIISLYRDVLKSKKFDTEVMTLFSKWEVVKDEILLPSRKQGSGNGTVHIYIGINDNYEKLKSEFPVYLKKYNTSKEVNTPKIKHYVKKSNLGSIAGQTYLSIQENNRLDKYSFDIEKYLNKLALCQKDILEFDSLLKLSTGNRIYFKQFEGDVFAKLIRPLFLSGLSTYQARLFKNNKNEYACFWLFGNSKLDERDIDIEFQYLYKYKHGKVSPQNYIFYGAPGTGKSHKIETEILVGVPEKRQERVTFHPDYDNASFVGSYMPSSDDDGNIRYEFIPQVFTNIYVKAWQNLDKPYYLVIEEINRGNCAEIFGDIFQLLDRKSNYAITPKSALQMYLKKTLGESDGIKNGKMILPPNLRLLATMNTSDQSLFPMDSAFKRRWTWKYVPIDYNKSEDENPSAGFFIKLSDIQTFSWLDFIEKVNTKFIKNNENLGEDKCIGNYFIRPDNKEISLEEFINKAIFYLWIDVFQEEEETPFESGVTYSDFFPEATKGKELVEKMLAKLNVSINNLTEAIETTEA